MNLWEDETDMAAVVASKRCTLLVAGLLTEACVSFPVLSALAEDYRVHVVTDACGGLTHDSHWAGATAHAPGRRYTHVVAASATRVPARLDTPRDVRGRSRDRGRARRRLWHRVGLGAGYDQGVREVKDE